MRDLHVIFIGLQIRIIQSSNSDYPSSDYAGPICRSQLPWVRICPLPCDPTRGSVHSGEFIKHGLASCIAHIPKSPLQVLFFPCVKTCESSQILTCFASTLHEPSQTPLQVNFHLRAIVSLLICKSDKKLARGSLTRPGGDQSPGLAARPAGPAGPEALLSLLCCREGTAY